jgi:hypothetical protein
MKFRASIIALSVSLRKEISFKLAAARCNSFISDAAAATAAAYFIDAYLPPEDISPRLVLTGDFADPGNPLQAPFVLILS